MSLRTKKESRKYSEHIKNYNLNGICELCSKPTIVKFKYWRAVKNIFPYDRIAKRHDMIIPIRHVDENKLTKSETKELISIKEKYIGKKYDLIVESTKKNKTIPEHFHIHLILSKF